MKTNPQHNHATVVLQPRARATSRVVKIGSKQEHFSSARSSPPLTSAQQTLRYPYNNSRVPHSQEKVGDMGRTLVSRFGIDSKGGRVVARILVFMLFLQPVYVSYAMASEEDGGVATEEGVTPSGDTTGASQSEEQHMRSTAELTDDVREDSQDTPQENDTHDSAQEDGERADAGTAESDTQNMETNEEPTVHEEGDQNVTTGNDEGTEQTASESEGDGNVGDAVSDVVDDSTSEVATQDSAPDNTTDEHEDVSDDGAPQTVYATSTEYGADNTQGIENNSENASTTDNNLSAESGGDTTENEEGVVNDANEPNSTEESDGGTTDNGDTLQESNTSEEHQSDDSTDALENTSRGGSGGFEGESDTEREVQATSTTATSTTGFLPDNTHASSTASSSEAVSDTSNVTGTSTEEVDHVVVAQNGTNKFTFAEGDCTPVSDGEFYCVKNDTARITTGDPRVYAEKDAQGDREIFYFDGEKVKRITNNSYDDFAPAFDKDTMRIVWQAMINDRLQIMLHEIPTNTTRQITTTRQNSSNPNIEGDTVVWQEWVDTNWEIMMTDVNNNGQEFAIERLTDNAVHDMFPQIHNRLITWQREKGSAWEVVVYDTRTKEQYALEKDEAGAKYENPRFVLLFDSRHDNGDVETIGYDLETGDMMELGTKPKRAPQDTPTPKDKIPDALPAESATSTALKVSRDADNDTG